MRRRNIYRKNSAVSEIIGGVFLVFVAVMSFSTIYLYVFPPSPDYDASVRIEGSINDNGIVTLKHIGGNPLESYKVVIYDPNGTYIGSKIEKDWCFGEYRYPLKNISDVRLIDDNIKFIIKIFSLNIDGKEQEIFTWEACGHFNELSTRSPILISSLKTNTPDEDLICYSYPVRPELNATSYIYNWKQNGESITDLNVPFDTENNDTCKDYSGNGLDGTLVDAYWSDNAIIGGSTYYGGSSEYITFGLPPVLSDIPNNDFSISIWINSADVTLDNAVILMASKDNRNFIKFFIQGNEVHIGVCCNGIKDAVRTESVSNSTWYHIVGVWDADEKSILVYCNGVEYDLAGYRNFALGSGVNLLEIGHGTSSSKFFNGYIDQLVVYKKALSQDQIYQIYLSERAGDYDRRIMVSEETNNGDTWQCIVTANDREIDDIPISSNILHLTNYPGGD